MLHVGYFVAALLVVSTLGQLASGQSTVDSELTTERCDQSGGDYTSLLTDLAASYKRLASQFQQQGSSSGSSGSSNNACSPREL